VLPATLLFLRAIAVEGAGECPSAVDVEQRIQALGVKGPLDAVHRARIEASPEGLTIRLSDSNGALLGEKTLAVTSSCQERAEAAAALIGAWEASLVAPQPNLGIGTASDAPVSAPPPRALPRPWTFEIGASFNVAADRAGLGAGFLGFLSLTAGSRGPGADLWLGALGARHIPLSDFGINSGDDLTWQRFPLGLGAHARLFGDPVRVDVHAEALIALLTLSAPASLLPRATAYSADAGAGLGARAQMKLGAVLIWLGAAAVVWPGKTTIAIGGAQSTQTLPQFELLIQQGLAFGASR
jgi:hypothetical protein